VRRAVTLCVAKPRPVGVCFPQAQQHIPHHVRVGILVDGDTRRSVRAEDDGVAADGTALGDGFTDLLCDVIEILPLGEEFVFQKHG